MKIIHLISGGDVGGAKTHVHSLLCGLAKTEEVQLVCFMDGPFAEEARQLNIPTKIVKSRSLRLIAARWRHSFARAAMRSSIAMAPGRT